MDIFSRTIDEPQGIEIGPNALSLEFLQACYRNASLPLSTRLRAASIAIGFEFPKLAMQANVDGKDFASLLDARLARQRQIDAMKNGSRLIEAKVEASKVEKPVEAKTKNPVEAPKVEAKPHLPA